MTEEKPFFFFSGKCLQREVWRSWFHHSLSWGLHEVLSSHANIIMLLTLLPTVLERLQGLGMSQTHYCPLHCTLPAPPASTTTKFLCSAHSTDFRLCAFSRFFPQPIHTSPLPRTLFKLAILRISSNEGHHSVHSRSFPFTTTLSFSFGPAFFSAALCWPLEASLLGLSQVWPLVVSFVIYSGKISEISEFIHHHRNHPVKFPD